MVWKKTMHSVHGKSLVWNTVDQAQAFNETKLHSTHTG